MLYGETGFCLLGGGRGESSFPPPPPPPKRLASDSTYHSIIRVAFIMSALITQELKFSLFKLSQVIKCLSFCTSHGKGYIPLPHPPPTATLSMMATPPPPPPISNPGKTLAHVACTLTSQGYKDRTACLQSSGSVQQTTCLSFAQIPPGR